MAIAVFTAGGSLIALNQRAALGLSSHFKRRRVGDRVLFAAQIGQAGEAFLENLVKPLHFGLVAHHRIGIVLVLRREHFEVGKLPEHRTDARNLKHQPLQHVVFLYRVLW